MTTLARFLSLALGAAVIAGTPLSARADYPPQILILKERCESQGGRFDYPNCYLPDQSSSAPPEAEDSCDGWCKLAIFLVGTAAARQAYCHANPQECR